MEQRRHHIAEVFRDGDAAAAAAQAARAAQAAHAAAPVPQFQTQRKGAGSDGA